MMDGHPPSARRSIKSILNDTSRFWMKFLTGAAYLVGFFILLHGSTGYSSCLIEDQQIRSGPIPIVNQSPIQLLFLQPIPDRARVLPRGRKAIALNTAITNTLLSESSGRYSGTVDMEMIRTTFDFRVGIHPRLELGISLPFVYSYSGIMDHAILDVEDFFTDPREIRENEEPNRYEYHVEKDNKPFIGRKRRSSGVGDLVFRIKGNIWEENNYLPCLSVRLELKVPTGDEDRALGSGEPDSGFGLLLEKEIKGLTAYLNADVIFPGDAYDTESVTFKEFHIIMLGAEYKFTPQFSAIAQMRYTTRPFDGTGLKMLQRRIYDLLLGVNYCTKGGVFIQGGGIEDFHDSCDAGSDVTFFLDIGRYF
ncbi:MAG: DUF3187 family protein [Deltaproteobacteria bacterium]|nr:DUF3187 family protein [Deltaproteobacteria bacterium]MBW1933163.1 DUF3187 family protein [Deltaproteobacteria bacterium]MBW1979458.1 DUF3187 family protein [Deltaproteobacteria bacterium]